MLDMLVTALVVHPDKLGFAVELLKALFRSVTVLGNWAVICCKIGVVPLNALLMEEKLLNVPKLATSNINEAPSAVVE
jgi:hypothetical protein